MKIEAIIAAPVTQTAQVNRLADYIRKLDGTEVRIIPIPKAHDDDYKRRHPGGSFACLQASGLRYCAKQMHGKPFFWLEHDSIPLKPGWLKKLTEVYIQLGKPYLLSADSHPPHDLVGGIGFYSGDTAWQIPDFFPQHGWDLWMIRHLKDQIATTSLIQHSYGTYDRKGNVHPHLFPQESWMIRPETLVFHRDRNQGLISGTAPSNTFLHSGDLGDIVAALPIMRQVGGGDLILTDTQGIRPMSNRMHLIGPLLEAVPYVKSYRFEAKPGAVTHDFSKFRVGYNRHRTLTESQAEYVKVPAVQWKPWLSVEPNAYTKGRIVVARSPRYHNPLFPWPKIAKAHKDRIAFIGLADEHAAFEAETKVKVERLQTANMLEMSQMIAGSDLFIGNQSSPCWLAMAMGHPLVQETHETIRDSIIPRDNAQFVPDGLVRKMP